MSKKELIYTLNYLKSHEKSTDSYLRGSAKVKWDKYDFDEFETVINLRPLHDKIQGVKGKINRENKSRASSDSEIAVEVHKALPLSKRQACDKRLWDFMNCVFGREYVVWRWKVDKEGEELSPGVKNRFLGNRRRSTFWRLWSIGELTRELGYDYTKRVLSNQDFSVAVFERSSFATLPLILKAYIDTVFDEGWLAIPEAVNRKLAVFLRRAGATVVLDSLDYAEAKTLIEELLSQAEGTL